jgi:hypothetical protein
MSLYPGSIMIAISWYTRDHQDKRPLHGYSLHAFGSTGFLACH